MKTDPKIRAKLREARLAAIAYLTDPNSIDSSVAYTYTGKLTCEISRRASGWRFVWYRQNSFPEILVGSRRILVRDITLQDFEPQMNDKTKDQQ